MATLASLLSQRSHQVTLVTLGDGQGDRHEVDAGVQRRRLNLLFESGGLIAGLLGNRRRIAELRRTIVNLAPDVVLSFCDRTNILSAFACPAKVPLVLSERSDPSQQRLGRLWEGLRNRAYPRATQLVALSETSAEHLRRRFSVPVTVIPSAVDVPPLRSDRDVANANRLVLGIGRLEPEKGFDRLIDAFAEAVGDRSDWRLRILGEGSCRSALEQLATRRGVGDQVELPGWVRPVWNELAAATMFVLSSRYEGFPSALLEAMVVGVPSITVDCESGPRAVLTDEQATAEVREFLTPHGSRKLLTGAVHADQLPGGLLVPNDTVSLVDAIRLFMADSATRESIGKQGTRVGEGFSWPRMVEHYESVLQKAAGSSSHAAPSIQR